MQKGKILAALLAVVLLLSQTGAVLAEATNAAENARPVRETRASASIAYYENPLLDEETNALLKALLNSLTFSSRTLQPDGGDGYGEFALSIGENAAVSVQYVLKEEYLYVASPLLPNPIAIKKDELPVLAERIQGYFGETIEAELDMDMEAFTAMAEINFDVEALMASMDEEVMASMASELEKWVETSLTLHPMDIDEPLESALGADITSAMECVLYAGDMEAFLGVLTPLFTEMDAYWITYYDMLGQIPGLTEELPPLDVFLETVHAIPAAFVNASIVPEEAAFFYLEGMDKDGNPSANKARFSFPILSEGEYASTLFLDVEWTAAGDEVLITFSGMDASVMLYLLMPEKTVTDTDEGRVTQEMFSALLSAADGEEQYTLGLDIVSAKVVNGGVTATDAEVILSLGDGVETFLDLDVLASNTTIVEAEDYASHTTVGVSLGMAGQAIDLVTFEHAIETGEPQGMPFDPASDILFFYPATLDQEAFDAWIDNEVMSSLMEQLFYVVGILPQEVLAAMMPAEEAMLTESGVAP